MRQLLQLLVLQGLLGGSFSAPTALEDGHEIASIINVYNTEILTKYLFKLQEVESKRISSSPDERKPVLFIIKETVCLKSENVIAEECDFKTDGVVMKCSASITQDESNSNMRVSCETMSDKVNHMNIKKDSKSSSRVDSALEVNIKKEHLTPECLECIFTRLPRLQ
ncbi:cathelicidin-6-like isoform 1-T1 [Discoglossus pictus]